jgi:type IV secretory pathway TrbD component
VTTPAYVTRVHKSLNTPLLIWGVDRRMFFFAALIGAATFNLFGSLIGGLAMFVALYVFARWTTASDPERLRILLNSARFRAMYDPFKVDVLKRAGR